MRTLILASASPRRQEYLALLGYPYLCEAANVDESTVAATDPATISRELARRKAQAVAEGKKGAIVIGADTVVAVENTVLGKPRDEADACRMLGLLSGRAHQVYTGLCVIDTDSGSEYLDCGRTTVWMQPITPEERSAYVASGEPMDKAGAYGIQGAASRYITAIEGCYFNVLGLPINKLYNLLRPLMENAL